MAILALLLIMFRKFVHFQLSQRGFGDGIDDVREFVLRVRNGAESKEYTYMIIFCVITLLPGVVLDRTILKCLE